MHVVLLHDAVSPDARPDELDVFAQAEAVEAALDTLGHTHARLPLTLDLAEIRQRLSALRPAVVFNLVEAVEGQGRLLPLASMLLDAMPLPYTGSHTEALFVTTNKVLTKRLLHGAGVPTAPWCTPDDFAIGAVAAGRGGAAGAAAGGGRAATGDAAGEKLAFPGTYIIKPVWEEASVGLDEDSVVPVRAAGGLQAALVRGAERCGGEVFAEQFIDGREFNLSVLAEAAADGTSAGGPDVLPPAEIDFVDYASGKPKVVGYRAKWDAASFEFHHTPRRFDFPSEDRPLLDELSRIAARCWRVFGLRGYVRVDFRVDAAGRPFVLEVNANPCLAPDAGFYAATQQAGLPFAAVVSRILADAMRGRP